MATTAEQLRAYSGPAVLSFGFRPFFLAGSVWAVAAIAVWLPFLAGTVTLPTAFAPVDWHVHALLFGFLPAIVAGFLLTAVPNWTGQLPVVGRPLLLLFLLWLSGRIANLTSEWIGALPAAVVDLSFLAVFAVVIAREILASGNWRNLKMLVLVGGLLVASAIHHWESASGGNSGFGQRLGLAVTVLLVTLIGGRVVPSFTRNWLVKRGGGRLPAPFDGYDRATVVLSAGALAVWIAVPGGLGTAVACFVAGMCQTIRLGRWAGGRTFAEPLVTILHAGYAFVPLGFLLAAGHAAAPATISMTAPVHAWAAGMVGVMTLAMMTRASLGHTGRPLTATRRIQLIYGFALLAAIARVLAALDFSRETLLVIAAGAWMAAFGGFALVFGAMLLTRRTR